MSRFILKRSDSEQGWWILSCPENGLSIRFEEHKFNDSQEVKFADPGIAEELGAVGLASLMREAGDWLFRHAYSIAMPTPAFEFREYEEEDKLRILKNSFPKLSITIEDDCDINKLADALLAASEFVRKNGGRL